MIDEEVLFSLSEGTGLESTPPLEQALQRSQGIRRRRRILATAATSVVACLAVGFAVPALIGGDERSNGVAGRTDSSTKPLVQKTDWRCSGVQRGPHVSAMQAAGARYLFSGSLAYDLWQAPTFTRDAASCLPAAQTVIWYSVSHGAVDRRLAIAGPDGGDPYGVLSMNSRWMQTKQSGDVVAIGPYRGKVSRTGGAAQWTVDGKLWTAESQGLTRKELLAALGSLTYADGRIDLRRKPVGLNTLLPSLGGPAPSTESFHQRVVYSSDSGYPKEQLDVYQIGDARIGANVGLRPVRVNGQPGWFWGGTRSRTRSGTLVWKVADGVYARFSTHLRGDEAVQLAASIRLVAPNDPRLPTAP